MLSILCARFSDFWMCSGFITLPEHEMTILGLTSEVSLPEPSFKLPKNAELSMVSPHVFIPLVKLGLSIVSGFRFKAKEGNKTLQEEIDECVHGQPEKQVPE